MTSQAKIEANRKNAQKSTGPKTPEGKQIASQNSTAHGLFAKNILTRREDIAEFESYRAAMLQDLAPVGQYETGLAERIIVLMWHLARSVRFQTESLDALVVEVKPRKIELPMSFDPYVRDDCQELGMSYDEYSDLSDQGEEAIMERVNELLKEMQDQENKRAQQQNESNNTFGSICVRDFSTHRVLDRLSIYEQRIQKQFFAARNELRQAQKERKALREQENVSNFITNLKEPLNQ